MIYLFKELNSMVEELIGKKLNAIIVDRMKFLQQYGYSGLELDNNTEEIKEILNKDDNAQNEYNLFDFDAFFIPKLRGFLFVAIYQYFENQLINHCEVLGEKKELISLKSIKGDNCIQRCKTYLSRVAKVKTPSENLWQTISVYNKLRNSIVHADAEFEEIQENGRTIKKFAQSNPFIEYVDFDDGYGSVNLGKEFCNDVLENIEQFLCELKRIAN